MALQVTLAIIKPHITRAPYALECIRNSILLNGFFVLKSKRTVLTEEQCRDFYAEHEGRFFFDRLVTFMSSGPVDVHVLARVDAIKQWRDLMGPTKTYQAQFTAPDTIRGRHGLSDTRNATHGSDSTESAEREIQMFFPDFKLNKWFSEEEKYYKSKQVTFVTDEFIHQVDYAKSVT